MTAFALAAAVFLAPAAPAGEPAPGRVCTNGPCATFEDSPVYLVVCTVPDACRFGGTA